jgi:hypothetical protein
LDLGRRVPRCCFGVRVRLERGDGRLDLALLPLEGGDGRCGHRQLLGLLGHRRHRRDVPRVARLLLHLPGPTVA